MQNCEEKKGCEKDFPYIQRGFSLLLHHIGKTKTIGYVPMPVDIRKKGGKKSRYLAFTFTRAGRSSGRLVMIFTPSNVTLRVFLTKKPLAGSVPHIVPSG